MSVVRLLLSLETFGKVVCKICDNNLKCGLNLTVSDTRLSHMPSVTDMHSSEALCLSNDFLYGVSSSLGCQHAKQLHANTKYIRF